VFSRVGLKSNAVAEERVPEGRHEPPTTRAMSTGSQTP
jgi:hypothetical protein